jgi:preprotein translocase subunit SecE
MKVINYLKEVRAELKRVVWPTRKQVGRLTSNVIVLSLIFGAFLGALDYIFTSITQAVLR